MRLAFHDTGSWPAFVRPGHIGHFAEFIGRQTQFKGLNGARYRSFLSEPSCPRQPASALQALRRAEIDKLARSRQSHIGQITGGIGQIAISIGQSAGGIGHSARTIGHFVEFIGIRTQFTRSAPQKKSTTQRHALPSTTLSTFQ
ncbi:hypothetical protein [Sporosarcina koreensis]|uniref:hypothetical protein n=1 Tax=Sporosarcina koreensis TaxID=334735 RepID=UPI00058F1BB1|nr:hypothetical protein [Sporosarcina koreensis]